MTPQQWLYSGDTGVSSLTIFHVMTGTVVDPTDCYRGSLDIPYDADDFGRCYRLLKSIPEWRGRLTEAATVLRKWAPLVERWNELEALYETSPSLCTDRLFELYPLCMKAEGWVRTGNYSLPRDSEVRK